MRRELWESPVAFKWTPLAIGALVIFFAIFTLVIGARVDAEMAFTSDAMTDVLRTTV
jgi:ABC-2 type transport system permease protein